MLSLNVAFFASMKETVYRKIYSYNLAFALKKLFKHCQTFDLISFHLYILKGPYADHILIPRAQQEVVYFFDIK